MFVFACGCGSDDPLERPSGSPPEETPEEVPRDETPEEWFHYANDEDGEPIYKRTRPLYNATNIEVFYTEKYDINVSSFASLTTLCIFAGVIAGHDSDKVGVLNGMFKEQGYTKNFLLNPDVERTWSGIDDVTSEVIAHTVDNEFLSPLLSNTSECTDSDGNEVTCKRFMCGVETGD